MQETQYLCDNPYWQALGFILLLMVIATCIINYIDICREEKESFDN